MDFDYFEEEGAHGDTVVQNPALVNSHQHPSNTHEDDDFNFDDHPQNEELPMQWNNPAATSAEEEETVRRVRQEEQRLHEQLRQKSNHEYELKQKRKEQARQQLEEFLEAKQAEVEERRRSNLEKQKSRQADSQGQRPEGWIGVAANVALKQGEHPGRKDVNRMRQAILNKKQDESR